MPKVKEVYEHVGRRIAEVRRLRGLTQEGLAELVDRSASYLARVEVGGKHATVDTLNAIAEALGEPIGAFFPAVAPQEIPSELASAVRGLHRDDVLLVARLAAKLARPRGDGAPRSRNRPPPRRARRDGGQ